MDNPQCLTPKKICEYFEVDPSYGLSKQKVDFRLKIFGHNELPVEPPTSWLYLIALQFNDILIWILLIAAFTSFLLAYYETTHEDGFMTYVEPFVILLILILNAAVGLIQESKAEKALQALKELQPQIAFCLRDGKWNSIPAKYLVPGDIVQMNVGDRIPADIRILELKKAILKVEQSQLTGESSGVLKSVEALPESFNNIELGSKYNLLFSSTTISVGGAIGCVFSTGLKTEIGKIQSAVKDASLEDTSTPLKKKLDEFAQLLTYTITIICIFIWVINYKNFFDPIHGSIIGGCIYYFKIAVALAVAAIPEGLPAVITTCLALGTQKMTRKNAIVRKLASVETLGCTSIICSDKTGTLTTNQMVVSCFYIPDIDDTKLKGYYCENHGYEPYGKVKTTDNESFNHINDDDIAFKWFTKCAANCNDSRIIFSNNKYSCQGEPTEAALIVLIEKLGCQNENLNNQYLQKHNRKDPMAFSNFWINQSTSLATLEFTRERKSMSVISREKSSQKNVLYVKGSPESILSRSSYYMLKDGSIQVMNQNYFKLISNYIKNMADEALRVLALAIKLDCGDLNDYSGINHPLHDKLKDYNNYLEIESNLIFLGLVGIFDPPRESVKNALKDCRTAGIKVMMITGDNKFTAEAISLKIGLTSSKHESNWSLTGTEFEKLSEEDKIKFLSSDGLVLSRMEPKQKQNIVRILKKMGETVAVTGDGVNDAPALKMSDIGISMGITGTEVAKEASDMILADDNFSTIVSAVEEGRSIYNNMKAFIRYLISSNIGEVISIFLTSALGIPEGLAPVQLLWVNLVTDGLPAIALSFNPADLYVMHSPPRSRNEKLISNWVFFRYLLIGSYVGFATVFILVWWYCFDTFSPDGHSIISFSTLSNWNNCRYWDEFQVNAIPFANLDNPCEYFSKGKIKASTLSLTVLVVIEMLNAYNALSEYSSLLKMPPYSNPYLILATMGSMTVHCCILYIPFLSNIFSVTPLSYHDWYWVLIFSFPVILIDEFLKYLGRPLNKTKSNTIKLNFSEIDTNSRIKGD